MNRLVLAMLITALTGLAHAAPLRIAVADDFRGAFEALVAAYSKQSAQQVEPTFGETGALYQQISNGSNFAALFADDGDHTAQLVADGRAKATTRVVYAIGRLALWTPGPAAPQPSEWLADPQHRVAVADPDTPYGVAARETLVSMQLWDQVTPRLVASGGVAQTLHAIETGAVPGGFVAYPQLVAHYHGSPPSAEVWLVPLNMHTPIVQEAVVVDTPDSGRAQEFLTFVTSDTGRAIIETHGYLVLAPTAATAAN
jgi:molybdate transport system substrate-binding protein